MIDFTIVFRGQLQFIINNDCFFENVFLFFFSLTVIITGISAVVFTIA